QHHARRGLRANLAQRDRFLLLGDDLLLARVGQLVLCADARIAGAGRHDLVGLIVGGDHRRRLGRAGRVGVAAVGIRAGGAEHGATLRRRRVGEPAAMTRARRVVVRLVLVRLERGVVLIVLLILLPFAGVCLHIGAIIGVVWSTRGPVRIGVRGIAAIAVRI